MKKCLLPVVFAAILMILACAPGWTQMTQEEEIALLSKEKPLTQADIEGIAKIWTPLSAVSGNQEEMLKLYKSVGLTEVRGAYVIFKVLHAKMILDNTPMLEEYKKTLPSMVLWPTPEEVELVKKNQELVKNLTL